MDLKRLRRSSWFRPRHRGEAALRLRIIQSPFRQISDLEYHSGSAFEPYRSRLFLTTRGEQCSRLPRVLGQLGSRWRRIGCSNVETPASLRWQHPRHDREASGRGFLPRYAERFPNVRVKLTEALGWTKYPARNVARFISALGMIRRKPLVRVPLLPSG